MQREVFYPWHGARNSSGGILADRFGRFYLWNDLARALMGIEAFADWADGQCNEEFRDGLTPWPDNCRDDIVAMMEGWWESAHVLLPVIAIQRFARAVDDASASTLAEQIKCIGENGHAPSGVADAFKRAAEQAFANAEKAGDMSGWVTDFVSAEPAPAPRFKCRVTKVHDDDLIAIDQSTGTDTPIELGEVRCAWCGGELHARGTDCPSFNAFRGSTGEASYRIAQRMLSAANEYDTIIGRARMVTALAKSWGRTDDLAKAEAERHVDAAAEWLRAELRRLEPWTSGGVTGTDASGLFVRRAKEEIK